MPDAAPQPRPLSLKQQAFISAYIGEANGNATESARIAGYRGTDVTLGAVGAENLKKPQIKAAITEHLAELKRQGITLKQNRLDAYNDRWQRLQRVITERGADPFVQDVPGGSTGLVVKQIKKVQHVYEADPDDKDSKAATVTIDQWEATVDTGLLKELRDLEKQAAQEVGDWVEKGEVTGKDGAPLLVVIGERPDGPQRQ